MSGFIRFFSPIEHAVFVEYLTYQIKAIYKIHTDDVDLSLMKLSVPVYLLRPLSRGYFYVAFSEV
jgi:hypothetical protein